MRNQFTNKLNLTVLFIFIIAPIIGFLSQTLLHKGFDTITIPILFICTIILLIFRKSLIMSRPLVWLMLFMIYTIISDGVLVNKEYNISYFVSNEIFASVMVLFIIENTFYPDKYMNAGIIISVLLLILAFIVSLVQEFVNITFLVNPLEQAKSKLLISWDTRIPSIYTWVGAVSALGLCFFPVLAIIIERQIKDKSKFLWVLFIMGAVVAFVSKSRFIMVNFLILIFLIPLYRKVNFLSIIKFILIAVIFTAALLGVANSLKLNVGNIVEKRILESDKGGLTKGVASTRLLAFEIFGKLYLENAVFGKGKLHDFNGESKDYDLVRALEGRSSQIHVGFLSLFYYYGLLGGGIFLGFIITMVIHLYRSARLHQHWGPLFGFIQFILTNFTAVWLQIYFMGLIVCFMFNQYYLLQYEKLNKPENEPDIHN